MTAGHAAPCCKCYASCTRIKTSRITGSELYGLRLRVRRLQLKRWQKTKRDSATFLYCQISKEKAHYLRLTFRDEILRIELYDRT